MMHNIYINALDKYALILGGSSVTPSRKPKREISSALPTSNPADEYPLSDLLLDEGNPRLGVQAGQKRKQIQVLDTIVQSFGVDDVLSSLAVNGYFHAEPLVGVRDPGNKIRIREGNRRLAACLILAGEDRARNHSKRTKEYQALQKKCKREPIKKVPVLVHDDDKELLSYLGVRHIAAAQPWDSYAKAAWVAQVIEKDRLAVAEVSEMIGDQHNTVARTLEGYYFVNQLIDTSYFNPQDSMKRGRGSNPDYPFSWIYTALGHAPIRKWLDLADLTSGPKKSPIKKNHLEDAGALMTFMLGNKTQSQAPAITDSRQIGDLARAIGDSQSRRLLKRGKSLDEVSEIQKPAKERIADGLYEAQEALQGILAPLSEGEIDANDASELFDPSKKVRNLAVDVNKRILGTMNEDNNED